MLDVAIIGASGYGGGELLRWLNLHPEVRVAAATSRTYAGKSVAAAFPGLAGRMDLTFTDGSDLSAVAECAVVFLAQENGFAMTIAPELLGYGIGVVDLSADFRFRDPAVYEERYKIPHAAPQWSQDAVYGLPELHHEEIRKARLVANPGCYATLSILALTPLLEANLVDTTTLIVDGKSGISGAGRSKFGLDYHFAEANESVSAYKIAGTHRHTPEIEQELSAVAGKPIEITFTPHLIPMTRGMLATCYATLTANVSADDLLENFRAFYRDAPFVHITGDLPATKHTTGSNMCHIGLSVDPRMNRVTVVAALDNLMKGAAGQAIQNMNLLCGFEETAGLTLSGMWP
jgi:N-acetyl-gamma-glutamyl-phosphate reductase